MVEGGKIKGGLNKLLKGWDFLCVDSEGRSEGLATGWKKGAFRFLTHKSIIIEMFPVVSTRREGLSCACLLMSISILSRMLPPDVKEKEPIVLTYPKEISSHVLNRPERGDVPYKAPDPKSTHRYHPKRIELDMLLTYEHIPPTHHSELTTDKREGSHQWIPV